MAKDCTTSTLVAMTMQGVGCNSAAEAAIWLNPDLSDIEITRRATAAECLAAAKSEESEEQPADPIWTIMKVVSSDTYLQVALSELYLPELVQ